MKAFEQLERVQRIIKLIKYEKTGTPDELANKMNISRRQLFCHLDDLREMGVQIEYSKQRRTYFFSNGHELELSYSFKVISKNEATEVFGGYSIFSYQGAFFMHSA